MNSRNSKIALTAVMVMSLTLGDLAFAQGNDRQDGRGPKENAQRSNQGNDRQNARGSKQQAPRQQAQRSSQGGARTNQGQSDRRDYQPRANGDGQRGPGAGPNHDFYRGGRISSEYRHRNYVVDDWRGHNLSAPPRGYQWVQTGADYALIAIATGIIADILLSR